VAATVARCLEGKFAFETLGEVKLKGKAKSPESFRLVFG
jgi:hypothetical protein